MTKSEKPKNAKLIEQLQNAPFEDQETMYNYLGSNADRAEVIADVSSTIYRMLELAHETLKQAETCEERKRGEFEFIRLAKDFVPVLRLLRDYSNDNKIHAEKLFEYFCKIV